MGQWLFGVHNLAFTQQKLLGRKDGCLARRPLELRSLRGIFPARLPPCDGACFVAAWKFLITARAAVASTTANLGFRLRILFSIAFFTGGTGAHKQRCVGEQGRKRCRPNHHYTEKSPHAPHVQLSFAFIINRGWSFVKLATRQKAPVSGLQLFEANILTRQGAFFKSSCECVILVIFRQFRQRTVLLHAW